MALYKQVQYSIEINEYQTDWFGVRRGVKQGCILSPILFNIFINDIIPFIKQINTGIHITEEVLICILLYADDIALLAEKEEDLQSLIDKVNTWCCKNLMTINVTKTKVLHMRKKSRSRSSFNFFCKEHIIDYCNECKYLGVCSRSKVLGGFMYQTFTQLYYSLVTPVMDYGCIIWGYKEHTKLTTIQNNAMRFFLGCNRNMPIAAMVGDMGWLPTHYRQMLQVLKAFFKISKNECNPILYEVFTWSSKLAKLGKRNWCWHCSKLISIVKGSCIELAIITDTPLYSQLEEGVHILALNEWQKQVQKEPDSNSESGGRLLIYKQLQSELVPSACGYITANISLGRRWIMATIRGGCLPLAIETGRLQSPKIPLSSRLCSHCAMDSVEDIPHFILFCPKYNNIRKSLFLYMTNYFPSFQSLTPNEKLKVILSQHHNAHTSYFIYKMFKTRNSLF